MKSPILNSPHTEPARYFKADERGLTEDVIDGRRPSSFYIPVPRQKTKQKQIELDTAEGAFGTELQKENEFINKVRAKIKQWRDGGYSGITKTSRDLLSYWRDDTRENKLFFCQNIPDFLDNFGWRSLRLDDISAGAFRETPFDFFRLPQIGSDDNRNSLEFRSGFQLFEKSKAVYSRKHNIKQDNRDLIGRDDSAGLFGVGRQKN